MKRDKINRETKARENRDRKRDRDGWMAKRKQARTNKAKRRRFEREGWK